MHYEVFPDTDMIDVWRAEAVDHDSEGECYVVIFSGPDSERRAREYVAWMSVRWAAGFASGDATLASVIPPSMLDEIAVGVREHPQALLGLIRRKPSDG